MLLATFIFKTLKLKAFSIAGKISYDGRPENAGQCVQLVEDKWLHVDKLTRKQIPLYPDAASYWEKGVPGFKKIACKPGVYPKYGDAVVWSRKLPGSGGHGHIDVCISRRPLNRKSFVGLDANWSPLTVTKVRHDYSCVLGYLRKKGK